MKLDISKWGALLALPAMLVSCNLDDDKNQTTQRLPVAVYNHIARLGGTDSDVVATMGTYTLDFNLTKGKMTVSTTTLKYNNSDHQFATDSIKFENTIYSSPEGAMGNVFTFTNSFGDIAAPNSPSVVGLKGCLTPFFYQNSTTKVPYYPFVGGGLRMVLSYTYADEYKVKAFYPDTFYAGTTTTTVAGAEPYTNKETLYRLVMDVQKKTADLIMYDVKFNDKMPTMAVMIVKGLKLTFTQYGYVAEAEAPIIPTVIEANQELPYPNFPFNTLKFSCVSSDLTDATIDFTVAERFSGSFKGNSIAQGFKDK